MSRSKKTLRALARMGTPAAIRRRVPFSLTCQLNCDAGSHIGGPAQAHREGWRIIFYNDGPSWNFLGECPDCRAADRSAS